MRRVGLIELVEGVLGRDGEQVVGRKMHKRCPHGGARYGEVTRAERVHLVGAIRVGLGLGAACERGAVDHERRSSDSAKARLRCKSTISSSLSVVTTRYRLWSSRAPIVRPMRPAAPGDPYGCLRLNAHGRMLLHCAVRFRFAFRNRTILAQVSCLRLRKRFHRLSCLFGLCIELRKRGNQRFRRDGRLTWGRTLMNIALPDGSVKEPAAGATVADVAASIGAGLAKAALAGKVDGTLVDLTATVTDGATVEIITAKSPEALHIMRHSCAHIMAEAVQEPLSRHADRLRPCDRRRLLLRFRAS